MGVCLTSRKSDYSFDMGYGGFNNLRTNIARAFDEELGIAYSDTHMAIMHPKEYDERINSILADEQFLFATYCEGKCSYKNCGKIYKLIKDIDFGGKIFTYAIRSDGKDYEKFKLFLKECYQKRRTMIWY